MWDAQRAFSELHYDVGDMDEETRDAKTRELALALHHEVSKLVSAVNFRGHRQMTGPVDRDKILYEAVDTIRYALAIANLWDFDDADFAGAWWDKDAYLNQQHTLQNNVWDGQPVFIWDIDDVLADFREGFSAWVRQEKGIPVDPSSREYFFIEQLAKSGYSSLGLYDEFIKDRGVASLPRNPAADVLKRLREDGYWIHLVTARPKENLICRYDTYHWLRDMNIEYDAIDFTAEKLAYVSRTQYCLDEKIVACVDDGPNHIRSYLAHDIKCFMPKKPYNESVKQDANLFVYESADQLYEGIQQLVTSKL